MSKVDAKLSDEYWRLVAGTVKSYLGQMKSIFKLSGRGDKLYDATSGGNLACSWEVKNYLKAIQLEQVKSHIQQKQAKPLFLVKLKSYFSSDRANDLGLVLIQEVKRFQGSSGIMFSHTVGKTLGNADAMLSSSKNDTKSLKKGSSASNEAKGKNPKTKSSCDESRSSKNGEIAASITLQIEQSSQKTDFVSLKSMVDEMYFVEGYDETQGADPDNSCDQFVDAEVVEPAVKKQKTSDKDCDNVFKVAAQVYRSKDNVNSSVDDSLADTVNEFFREGISEDKYNELMKSVSRPENNVALLRTRANQFVWNLLSPQTRSFDSVIQLHQETVVQAACNVTKLLNIMCRIKPDLGDDFQQDMQSCIDFGIDSLALLLQYNKMTNVKRKEYQRYGLSPEYHHLSSPSIPFTDMLDGDNVHQKSKEIQDMNRLGRNLTNARGRGVSYGRERGIGRGRGGPRRGGFRGGRGYGGRGQYHNDQSMAGGS
ncbi:unnamed protein product [Mytilus coruscus]|uniref:Uncharacterized protein n=1 Tax=Mytilus coruscus TaxID=42192 RepID=A0A6J8CGG0_MYTCO|nr:unnamed protein product [Mytilus coruscus]